MFVCVEVLRPSQPNGVMSSAVSLPNHTFTGQAKSSKQLTSIVHILSPETDNCPSWISGRERMTVENISWSISTKECCRLWRGLNPRPGLQSDSASNWATEAGRYYHVIIKNVKWLLLNKNNLPLSCGRQITLLKIDKICPIIIANYSFLIYTCMQNLNKIH